MINIEFHLGVGARAPPTTNVAPPEYTAEVIQADQLPRTTPRDEETEAAVWP